MPSLIGSWSEFDGALVTVRIGVSRQELLRLRTARQAIPQPAEFMALIDCGAQMTCVDATALRGLGLTLYGVTPINVPALGGLSAAVQYAASFILVHPSGNPLDDLVIPDLPLTEIDIGAIGYQILLGRDVLTLCNFHLDGLGLTFSLDY